MASQNPVGAAHSLEQCLLGTRARAAVLVGQDGQILGLAGALSPEQANAATPPLMQCAAKGKSVLAFLSIEGLGEALLCGAPVGERALGLLFTPETRLADARSQLGWLLECLKQAGKPLVLDQNFAPEEPLPAEAFTPLFEEVPPPDPDAGLNLSAAKVQAPESTQPHFDSKQCACVFLPRVPNGLADKAEKVRRALTTLAESRDWRLLSLSHSSDYLLFTLETQAEIRLDEILGAVREHTSAAVGAKSGFWHPSYLLGTEQISPDAAARFAEFIRAHNP